METQTFYATAAQLCFTLLGLWWAVVQFRHREWMRDPAHHRMAYAVALHFLLPGVMSLIALLAADVPLLWRLTFGLSGALGIVALLLLARAQAARADRFFRYVRAGQYATVVLYAVVTVIAFEPALIRNLGGPIGPLEAEGIALSLIVFFGVNFAWALFAGVTEAPDEG